MRNIQTANKRYMKLKGRTIDGYAVSSAKKICSKDRERASERRRGRTLQWPVVNGLKIESERANKGKISVRTDDNNVLR